MIRHKIESIELTKEINDRINYFYKKLDGTYKFPNSAEGDILKLVHKLVLALKENN